MYSANMQLQTKQIQKRGKEGEEGKEGILSLHMPRENSEHNSEGEDLNQQTNGVELLQD